MPPPFLWWFTKASHFFGKYLDKFAGQFQQAATLNARGFVLRVAFFSPASPQQIRRIKAAWQHAS